jgi:hypothetical protein
MGTAQATNDLELQKIAQEAARDAVKDWDFVRGVYAERARSWGGRRAADVTIVLADEAIERPEQFDRTREIMNAVSDRMWEEARRLAFFAIVQESEYAGPSASPGVMRRR